MPNLTVSVPHRLPQDEALTRIKELVAQAKAHYSDKTSDLRESWDGYVGKFDVSAMGFSASANLNVQPSEVTIELTLPFAAIPIRGKIESTVREALTKRLA